MTNQSTIIIQSLMASHKIFKLIPDVGNVMDFTMRYRLDEILYSFLRSR